MGKASARKRSSDVQLVMDADAPGPHNNPDIAREVLRAYEAFLVAAGCIEALSDAVHTPALARALNLTAENLRHLQRLLAPAASAASATLNAPAPSIAGLAVLGSDGSSVSVDAAGFVQHTASPEVLRAVGLAVFQPKAEGVRKALK